MTDDEPNDHERTDLDARDARALGECMTTLPAAPGMYRVVGEHGDTYTVDAREGRCTCPDHKHRDVRCKHLRRVAFATGERAVPAWVDPDGVDPQLGAHVDATPRVAAADGGILEAGDEGEVLADGDDGRPDDCDCGAWNADGDLPCWPCYREGFRSPAGGEGA